MYSKIRLTSVVLIVALVSTALALIGCGGSVDSTGGSSDSGNVALFLADGPADDYDHIWAGVKEVLLIPADGGDQVSLFRSPYGGGKEVDLLDLADQKLLLSVKKDVPAGVYSKIRLVISYIHPEGGTGPCADEDLEIKLPSGKIDLNPRENFRVAAGKALAISLDMDMDKSMQLKEAGKSGKCIFRPVIFVDIETIDTTEACPRVLTGKIDELIYKDEPVIVFMLDLKEGRGLLKVELKDKTVIFDKNGFEGDSDDLEAGQTVHVRGRLNDRCNLEASVIVIGGVEKFQGTVIESSPDDFTLKLANEAGTLNVELTDSTIIFIGCDEPFEDGIIPMGYKARVFGKFEAVKESNIYRAIVVFLKPNEPTGLLTDISETVDGYDLTIKTDETNTLKVFLPEDAPVKLKGDGRIDIFRLNEWVECHGGIEVEVELDPAKSDPLTAEKLIVLPDEISAVVDDKSNSLRILYTTEGDIAVEEYATILKVKNDQQKLIEFEYIKVEDEFVAYGIEACPNDSFADFYAFIVSIENQTSINACEDGLKPQVLEMRYTGEDCAASNHYQDPKKTSCEGDPNFDPKVFVSAIDKKDPHDSKANVWFEGTVKFKDTFQIDATNAGKDKLKAETWVFIYDHLGGTLLQKIKFHTSCSQPLAVEDHFGSLILKDIEFVHK